MERKGFIGGSDCYRIMQGHWQEVWEIKTGRKKPDDLSMVLPVQLGIYTEPFNISWFETHTQNKVQFPPRIAKTIGSVPAAGLLDGQTDKGNVVETKHTNARKNMDDIIQYYMPQIQLYAKLIDADGIHMSVIFGNERWESAFVRFDRTYFNAMWSVIEDFWSYVIDDIAPPQEMDTPIKINTDPIPINDMIKRDASNDNAFVDAAQTFVDEMASAKTFENVKKDLKAMVGNNEREVYCDQLTIKRSANRALRFTVTEKTNV